MSFRRSVCATQKIVKCVWGGEGGFYMYMYTYTNEFSNR